VRQREAVVRVHVSRGTCVVVCRAVRVSWCTCVVVCTCRSGARHGARMTWCMCRTARLERADERGVPAHLIVHASVCKT
jgi:hypothetical protein